MLLFANVVLYCVAIQVAHALPFVKRIVIDPHITSPDAATVWTPGNDELVTWDTSTVPPTGDYNGTLLLGYQTDNSENLDLEHPLAVGFSLRDGSVRVTCPVVSPANNYIVVLMGDSGNASPQFTISGTNQDSAASPPQDLAASQSNQPSSTEPVSSPSTSTHTSQSATTPTSGSHSSALTSYTTPSAQSPHTGSTTPGSSTSSESSSASAASSSPTAGSSSNNAIPRTLNMGAMTAGVVIAVFMMSF
ncbi:hypothetical protein BJV74DRAFT_901563 [Russula compacta]|nr:hypothetical protein BJV74DRAFT_901563 [Russula compacta]